MKVLPLAIASLFTATIYANDIENVTVTSSRPYYYDTLSQIFPQQDYMLSEVSPTTHVNTALLRSPVISLNGQGGLLQNVSIRGFSRWRVQSMLDGVPIISDRRAGTSYGFVPSDFISAIYVLPGAASTYLGSGAIGGATDIHVSRTDSQHWKLQLGSNQQNRGITYADSNDNTDWKLAYNKADNGEDASGNDLYNQYTQHAIFVRHQPNDGMLEEVWSLYSSSEDVGKSSSDFPDSRITIYPSYSHWLGKARFKVFNSRGNVWWHQSSLDTSTLRVDSRINDSKNQSLDFGANIGNKALIGPWKTNWQINLVGRNGVTTDETERSLAQETVYSIRTLDASEHTINGLFDASTTLNTTALAWGSSVSWQQQKQQDLQVTNTNMSGFIGLNQPMSSNWSASVYLSSAYRVPSLTERFYNGETPRGTVIGDVNLDTERASNLQGTLSYNTDQLTGSIELFYQRISNYIERIELTVDTLQYTNLDKATIKGVSFQFNWLSPNKLWQTGVNGAWIKGEDQANKPLQDIPAHKLRFDISRQIGQLRAFTAIHYRATKSAIGDSERTLNDVTTIDIGADWQLSSSIAIAFQLQNLTNQHYYTSADDSAPFAQGKNAEISLSLTF